MSAPADPFQHLLEIANRSRSGAMELPAQLQGQAHWSGVGFSTGGQQMVAAMGEVTEILAVPVCTRLPRVRNWVRGVANVRGRHLPLIDLEGFCGGQLSANRRQHRVLVVEADEFFCGLIVDEVFGIKHFPVEAFVAEDVDVDRRHQAYIGGAYAAHDGLWPLLRTDRLVEDPAFLDTAI